MKNVASKKAPVWRTEASKMAEPDASALLLLSLCLREEKNRELPGEVGMG